MSATAAELDPYKVGRARGAHAPDHQATGHG
jgi:hypothetical protein